ncbi:L-glutamate gamma-semialdehyde dehydrogenase, partial [Aneurinibacillus migulanus]|nr:L-glutamate gamma-semialdehyde dehydrogenase [Aneurinibacillus migulanus]
TGSRAVGLRIHERSSKVAPGQIWMKRLVAERGGKAAIVGVHPFGGFNMSGTDSKAGGPDYLLQFTQPKLSSEIL